MHMLAYNKMPNQEHVRQTAACVTSLQKNCKNHVFCLLHSFKFNSELMLVVVHNKENRAKSKEAKKQRKQRKQRSKDKAKKPSTRAQEQKKCKSRAKI
jgi:hypothetical protein